MKNLQKTILRLYNADRSIHIRFTELPRDLVCETTSFGEGIQDVNVVFNNLDGKVLPSRVARYAHVGYVKV